MPVRHRSISARASLLLGLGLLAGVAVGCMTPVGIPPQYRFACETDEDCQVITDEDGEEYQERCISGLCQYPCAGSVFASIPGECPGDDYFGCFNGVCAHLCDTESPMCPDPQTCITQSVPEEFADLIPSGVDLSSSGVCGIRCDAEGAPECPGEQLCLEGVCISLSDFTTGGGTDPTGGTGTTGGTP